MKNNYMVPNWPAPSRVQAYTTTRVIPGFSAAPYDQFNLGDHVGDLNDAVNKNREKLVDDLNLPHATLWLKQVHGTKVVEMDQYVGAHLPTKLVPEIEADACYSRSSNTICAVLTADCLPILICNKAGSEVAAIHAGWRGLLAGVIENTIAALSSDPAEILAWLGPAIGPSHFQINQEIRSAFLEKNSSFENSFILRNGTDWFADLFQLARITLLNIGVSAVYGDNHCTYSNNLFYSYRRDQQLTGRMASLIWIDKM